MDVLTRLGLIILLGIVVVVFAAVAAVLWAISLFQNMAQWRCDEAREEWDEMLAHLLSTGHTPYIEDEDIELCKGLGREYAGFRTPDGKYFVMTFDPRTGEVEEI